MSQVIHVYMRVSTTEQDTTRQHILLEEAKATGARVLKYEEKESGAKRNRPELNRMIENLMPGDVIYCEAADRLSRLPLAESDALLAEIKAKGAKLVIPGLADLSEYIGKDTLTDVVMTAMQTMLTRFVFLQARTDYENRRKRQAQGIELAKKKGVYKGRKADNVLHNNILELLNDGKSVRKIASLLNCNPSTVQRVKKEAIVEPQK